jgi:hypothetical protein
LQQTKKWPYQSTLPVPIGSDKTRRSMCVRSPSPQSEAWWGVYIGILMRFPGFWPRTRWNPSVGDEHWHLGGFDANIRKVSVIFQRGLKLQGRWIVAHPAGFHDRTKVYTYRTARESNAQPPCCHNNFLTQIDLGTLMGLLYHEMGIVQNHRGPPKKIGNMTNSVGPQRYLMMGIYPLGRYHFHGPWLPWQTLKSYRKVPSGKL